MKTARLVLGIISMMLFLIIMFQSCAASVYTSMSGTADSSGGAGVFLSFFVLAAGIVGTVTRNSKPGGITAGALYLFGALIGFTNLGAFTDLAFWAVISLAFGLVLMIGSIRINRIASDD